MNEERQELVDKMVELKGQLLEVEKSRNCLKRELSGIEAQLFGVEKRPVGRPKKYKPEPSESIEEEEDAPKQRKRRKLKVKTNNE